MLFSEIFQENPPRMDGMKKMETQIDVTKQG